MSAPMYSSASARSPCVMSTPLTRAMTGSDAEVGASEDEFLEQPEAAGTMKSKAATVANAIGRRRGAGRGSMLRGGMAGSWIERPLKDAPESWVKRRCLAIAKRDCDENVSVWSPIDKGVTPSYVSTSLADPTASRRRLHESRSKSAAFPHPTPMDARRHCCDKNRLLPWR